MAERIKGEPLSKLMSRFVKSKVEKRKDVKPRLVVGYAEAKREVRAR